MLLHKNTLLTLLISLIAGNLWGMNTVQVKMPTKVYFEVDEYNAFIKDGSVDQLLFATQEQIRLAIYCAERTFCKPKPIIVGQPKPSGLEINENDHFCWEIGPVPLLKDKLSESQQAELNIYTHSSSTQMQWCIILHALYDIFEQYTDATSEKTILQDLHDNIKILNKFLADLGFYNGIKKDDDSIETLRKILLYNIKQFNILFSTHIFGKPISKEKNEHFVRLQKILQELKFIQYAPLQRYELILYPETSPKTPPTKSQAECKQDAAVSP